MSIPACTSCGSHLFSSPCDERTHFSIMAGVCQDNEIFELIARKYPGTLSCNCFALIQLYYCIQRSMHAVVRYDMWYTGRWSLRGGSVYFVDY